MIRPFIITITLVCSLTVNTFGYGNAGHQAVGTIAEHFLQGTRAGGARQIFS
jgi:hypothetical protein